VSRGRVSRIEGAMATHKAPAPISLLTTPSRADIPSPRHTGTFSANESLAC
jgi:hypothetical protein